MTTSLGAYDPSNYQRWMIDFYSFQRVLYLPGVGMVAQFSALIELAPIGD